MIVVAVDWDIQRVEIKKPCWYSSVPSPDLLHSELVDVPSVVE